MNMKEFVKSLGIYMAFAVMCCAIWHGCWHVAGNFGEIQEKYKIWKENRERKGFIKKAVD